MLSKKGVDRITGVMAWTAILGIVALIVLSLVYPYNSLYYLLGAGGIILLMLLVLASLYQFEKKYDIWHADDVMGIVRTLLQRVIPIITIIGVIAGFILFLAKGNSQYIWAAGYNGMFLLFTLAANLILLLRKKIPGLDYL